MNEQQPAVISEPAAPTTGALFRRDPAADTDRRPRSVRLVLRLLPGAIALLFVAALVYVGQTNDWGLPKFSAFLGRGEATQEDWCPEHSVPESTCVECQKDVSPSRKEFGWCRVHGLPDCPLEHPEVAQLSTPPEITKDDRERAQRSLAFAPRVENSSKCKLHQRRIQFTSLDTAARLGVEIGPVVLAPITEAVTANGEIVYDTTRVARVSTRVPGTIRVVAKQVGDRVRRGEILAVVDAVEVGKAKAELQQAMTQVQLKEKSLARLQELAGDAVAIQSVQDAEAALEESRVRLLTAEQFLVNLGISVRAADLKDMRPEEVTRRLRFLGLPAELQESLGQRTTSSNLLPITSPLDGEVITRSAVVEEQADGSRELFVVADTREMWLMLNVRSEDANLLRPGLKVRFRHEGHDGWDEGTVAWISLSADEKKREVPVRIELPNLDGRHHARTFGSARVVLREEPSAVVVPSEAVHWEGDCNIVFVRDKHFDEPGTPKVFHVRKVRPGAIDGVKTEVIAGVLPGELVATKGSGIMRAELLKNNLGAG